MKTTGFGVGVVGRVSGLVLAASVFCWLPKPAAAGVRPYAFVEGFDSLAQGDVELESWFGAAQREQGTSWDWWFGPVVGLTDQFEAGLFAIFRQAPQVEGEDAKPLLLDSLRLQLSYQLAPKGEWPIDVRLRAEYGQPIAGKGVSGWVSAVASWDSGPLNLTGTVGSWVAKRPEKELDKYLTYGVGASVDMFSSGLRLGGEVFGSTYFDTGTRLTLGPSLAYGIGRFWLSANIAAGLTETSPDLYGRFILGLLF